MRTLSRKDFLRSLAALAIGSAAAPVRARAKIEDLGIVDLHCHPSLKMYLLRHAQIWKKHHPRPGPNFRRVQISVDELKSGWVRGMLCAHYLPEGAIKTEPDLPRVLYPFIKSYNHLFEKIEYQDASNFTQINVMIDTLETQLHRANREQCDVELVIARNFAEFEQAIRDGRIPVAHAIEGAHALGRNFPLTSIECDHLPPEFPQTGSMHGEAANYLRNLDALKMRGVCLITLSHFFENDLSFPVEGISADTKKWIGLHWKFDPKKGCDRPLTEVGAAVVRRMLDIGVIVDLTHATPKVRQQVFRINRERQDAGKPVRPLTFTHTGSQAVFDRHASECKGGPYTNYRYYSVCDEEIEQICKCRGVIGIIPENFWLVGCDPALDPGDRFRNGIRYMVETIQDINSKTHTKDYDNIAIGTDFDGLADAPADLYKPSQLGALMRALHEGGLTPAQIRKITSGNAMRLLKEGWT